MIGRVGLGGYDLGKIGQGVLFSHLTALCSALLALLAAYVGF